MTRRYALRDDQWERIEGLLPGRKETVARRPKTIAFLLKPFFTAIALAFHGAIYRSDLVIGALFTRVSAVGQTMGFGKKCSNVWPPMPIMNTP